MTVHELMPGRFRSRAFEPIGNFEPFARQYQEMDRWWDETFSGLPTTSYTPWFGGVTRMVPWLDITEKGDMLEIWVDLPGMEAKDVSVTLTEGILTITGERKEEEEKMDRNFFRTERHFGSFFRRVALPYDVEADRIDAQFHNGVLKIMLPKSRKAKAEERHIEVKAA